MANAGIIDLHGNNIDIKLGGIQIGKIKVPSDYVPYTFAPILGVHELVTGDHLMEGMIVVVEDKMIRRNPNVLSPEYPDRARGFVPSEYDRASVEEQSRWALVTDLDKRGEIIKFTAIYSDGTMRSRSYNKSIKWAALKEFEMLPVCPDCGVTHQLDEESDLDIDEVARNVTSQILGKEMSFDEFSDRLKEDPSFIDELLGNTLRKIFGNLFGAAEAEIPADGQREDETRDEYMDRLRDEDEANGDYSQDERPKLKDPIKLSDDDALDALRAKLRGEKPAITVQTNQ